MFENLRVVALVEAVSFCRDIDQVTDAAEVVRYANEFHAFLTADGQAAPASDGPIETSEAEAKPPKPAAKPRKPAATATAPAGSTETKTSAPVDAQQETPASEPEKPAATSTAKADAKEPPASEVSQAVVKLVTKVGRDAAVKFMQDTFGAPNVSGIDTAKHPYSKVLKLVTARIAQAAEQAATA